jgi:hypothetical protein
MSVDAEWTAGGHRWVSVALEAWNRKHSIIFWEGHNIYFAPNLTGFQNVVFIVQLPPKFDTDKI